MEEGIFMLIHYYILFGVPNDVSLGVYYKQISSYKYGPTPWMPSFRLNFAP